MDYSDWGFDPGYPMDGGREDHDNQPEDWPEEVDYDEEA